MELLEVSFVFTINEKARCVFDDVLGALCKSCKIGVLKMDCFESENNPF
jgi:hypothetical protein